MKHDTAAQRSETFLNITFEGLCLFEMHEKSATVHFIDGKRAGVGEHAVILEAQTPNLVSTTLEAAPSHIIQVAAGTRAWTAPPDFGEITGPFNGAANGLKYDLSSRDGVPPQMLTQLPAWDPAWRSLDFVANLNALCGAKGIKPQAPFLGQMQLAHGELYGRPPSGEGGTVQWIFKDPRTNSEVGHQVLTDTLLYSCPIDDDLVTINVGNRELVLRRVNSFGQAISLFIRSLPAGAHMHGMKMTPWAPLNLQHFKAFYRVVNASFDPRVTPESLPPPSGTARFVGRQGGEVEPVYCNPAAVYHRYP